MNNLHLDLNLNNLSENDKEKLLALVEKAQTKKSFNPFERVECDETYYYIDDEGLVESIIDDYSAIDDAAFNCHNYYNDEDFAERQALRELLNRELIKFSYENGGSEIDDFYCASTIWYHPLDNRFFVENCKWNDIFTPIFVSCEVAERAIEEVIKPFMAEHPNFKIWG